MKRVLGLDIGGANLKMAHSDGTALTVPFELWKHPEMVPTALTKLVAAAPTFDEIAVTMTGELCDCFDTKQDGVHAILDAVVMATPRKPLWVWCNDSTFVDVDEARDSAQRVAAANWLATATFAGRFVPIGPALLVDTGSTTTDVVPMLDGKPVPKGRTDVGRLNSAELVYTGVRRTPVCAVLPQGQVAAELFATMLDVYLLRGDLPEDAGDFQTANGQAATAFHAYGRLARMLCADRGELSLAQTKKLARLAARAQLKQMVEAIAKVVAGLGHYPQAVVVAGSGEFLARRAANAYAQTSGPHRRARAAKTRRPRLVSMSARLGRERSTAACAYAVAVLAAERS